MRHAITRFVASGLLALALGLGATVPALAQEPGDAPSYAWGTCSTVDATQAWSGPNSGWAWGMHGPGMMGGGWPGNAPDGTAGPGQRGWGPGGMMGGWGPGGMMGGMMGWSWNVTSPAGKAIGLEQAQQSVQAVLDQSGNRDLSINEIMEFQGNFYALVKEKSTGTGACELLVNQATGAIFPEPGPNMMWNTKYGMLPFMGWMMGYEAPTGPMTISANQAQQTAQEWLDRYQPGSTTEPPETFYGYYTLHTVTGGKPTGMLSVNGYTGAVWYHSWHGSFIQEKKIGR